MGEKEVLLTAKNAVSAKAVSAKAAEISREFALIDPRDGKAVKTIEAAPLSDKAAHAENMQKLVKELAGQYDRPMTPSKIRNGKLEPGQSRVILDEKALLQQLMSLPAFDRDIILPITETSPNVTAESLTGASQKVIGTYRTTFNSTVKGRSMNIALSANAIDQIVLGPGDRFAFNQTVGERTPARGYQKAMEIVNKEFVEGIGGGICQTSSTLYNAVAQAGLEIIELHHHSKEVGYVPINKDATVSWGGYDFKFMNSKDHPVIIKTMTDLTSGSLQVQIIEAVK
ncbi:VanW family protein [Metabacillus indicus]|uniref:VanW family protein n=1 Tax=Metabacillus indicus TaxID=246786 RepID=UPI00068D9586|nr:VanW family protein [Metabacillus indicus]